MKVTPGVVLPAPIFNGKRGIDPISIRFQKCTVTPNASNDSAVLTFTVVVNNAVYLLEQENDYDTDDTVYIKFLNASPSADGSYSFETKGILSTALEPEEKEIKEFNFDIRFKFGGGKVGGAE